MLYNFPKEEIMKFYVRVFGEAEADQILGKNQFHSDISESIAIFNFKDIKKIVDDHDEFAKGEDKKRIEVMDSDELSGKSLQDISLRRKPSSDSFDGEIVGKKPKRKLSFVDRIRKHKVMPTNVGNQIAVWCDSIYDEYGVEDRLYFDKFLEWAKANRNFILTFARYFRYNMWHVERNELTNKEYLGFYKMCPVLQETIKIKFDSETKFVTALGCLYIEFLFLWYDRSRNVPNCIKVLKDVNIFFGDNENKIRIEQQSKKYDNFTILIAEKSVYLYWKEILTNYSRFFKKRPNQQ